MPESPSSSFIPKRGVGNRPTTKRKSNFILLAVISYALFVSAPLASAAVFIYERHTQNQFNKAVVNLDEAIKNFNQADLQRVTDFNQRLVLSKDLLSTHVSMVKLFNMIESATAETVRFSVLDIKRIDEAIVSVEGKLITPKLDGAIFQRSAFTAVSAINEPLFTEVKLVRDESTGGVGDRSVEFQLNFSVPVSAVQYNTSLENTGLSEVTPAEDTSEMTESIMTDDADTMSTDTETNI